MKAFIKVILFILIIFLIGCNNSNKSQKTDDYTLVIGSKEDLDNKLKEDSLTLFFETGFNNDLINIKYKGKNQKYFITTDGSTGYADFIKLGKLSNFKSVEFNINNGRLIKLKDLKSNLILVNYKKDSIVWVDFTNNFKSYK
jgi:hypothetical protein